MTSRVALLLALTLLPLGALAQSDREKAKREIARLLVEAEKIAWDTTVGDVYGDGLDVHEDWRDVTIAQLLRNRGGAPFNLAEYGILTEPKILEDDLRRG